MARKTYLELVNSVLARLRRAQVTATNSSTYSSLIAELVNQSKREVEDAWPWTDLRTETTLTTVAGTRAYSLTGYGERYRVQSVYNNTKNGIIRARESDFFDEDEFLQSTPNGPPSWWRIFGFDSNGDPQMEFSPTPDAVYDLRVVAWVPQADLSTDATQLSVPHWPVVLNAYALAIKERGEDGGATAQEAKQEYQSALNDAVSMDNVNQDKGRTSDWVVE